ncbi:hypothetical protein AXF42_Ash010270 [Apostasia shenzhenica]|uniref:Uncharacterized protein n=1 Tax=Apostasia shenzhenica TaxID=1088818 RepID=A0A2I0A9Y9_9ASPA|nr:hypothetical protein AXF42_Ash010270 [Apostasia shenzhenica]
METQELPADGVPSLAAGSAMKVRLVRVSPPFLRQGIKMPVCAGSSGNFRECRGEGIGSISTPWRRSRSAICMIF